MKTLYITLITVIFFSTTYTVHAQNVGIGTTTPDEQLDVNGNIHMRGNLKVNGSFGSGGQVLMNSGGNTVWSDIAGSYKSVFKNFATYVTSGTSTWTVPAGVTRIMIEAWGGGGGGLAPAGGGGGAYILGITDVAAGTTVSITVGAGGGGGANEGATNGTASRVAVAGKSFSAGGGSAALQQHYVTRGLGGRFLAYPSSNQQFLGMTGQTGQFSNFRFERQDETTSYIINEGGYGGDAGNTNFTGGSPRVIVTRLPGNTLISYTTAPQAGHPGGGGGGGNLAVGGNGLGVGGQGADGMVIIYW